MVRGHVQGVYFRDTTREAAERHGVAGWAANLPDGTVELVLEGAPEAVEAVLAVARRAHRTPGSTRSRWLRSLPRV